MSEHTVEIEAKFAPRLDSSIPQYCGVGAVASTSEPVRYSLSAVYFDTEDMALTRNKLTLRRRTGGSDEGWHLKTPAARGRKEFHAPLSEGAVGEEVVVPESLRREIQVLVRGRALLPIAQVDNERTVIQLCDGDGQSVAEFCDDHVTTWSLLPGGEKKQWREWEIELTGGDEDLLTALARATVASGVNLSSSPSKLVAALGNSWVPPTVEVLPEGSPAQLLVAALAAGRDKLLALDPEVRVYAEDSVHQMRVTTREMRSQLQTFEGIVDPLAVSSVESGLKSLAKVLGAARDAEVALARFQTVFDSGELIGVDLDVEVDILDRLEKELQVDLDAVWKTLDSSEYFALLDSIDALIAHPPLVEVPTVEESSSDDLATDQDKEDKDKEDKEKETKKGKQGKKDKKKSKKAVDPVLASHLQTAWDAVEQRHEQAVSAQNLPREDVEDLFHSVRKSAKRLRYAAAATGLEKTDKLVAACKVLQDCLGESQDAVTARAMIARFAQAAREEGRDTFGYGVLFQREVEASARALQAYAKAYKEVEKRYRKVLKG